MIQVGPMDERGGYFSFGAAAAHAKMIADNATTVVVEVNNNMPSVLGDVMKLSISARWILLPKEIISRCLPYLS